MSTAGATVRDLACAIAASGTDLEAPDSQGDFPTTNERVDELEQQRLGGGIHNDTEAARNVPILFRGAV